MFAKLFSWGSGASDTDLTEEEEERQMVKTWEGIIQRAANNKKVHIKEERKSINRLTYTRRRRQEENKRTGDAKSMKHECIKSIKQAEYQSGSFYLASLAHH